MHLHRLSCRLWFVHTACDLFPSSSSAWRCLPGPPNPRKALPSRFKHPTNGSLAHLPSNQEKEEEKNCTAHVRQKPWVRDCTVAGAADPKALASEFTPFALGVYSWLNKQTRRGSQKPKCSPLFHSIQGTIHDESSFCQATRSQIMSDPDRGRSGADNIINSNIPCSRLRRSGKGSSKWAEKSLKQEPQAGRVEADRPSGVVLEKKKKLPRRQTDRPVVVLVFCIEGSSLCSREWDIPLFIKRFKQKSTRGSHCDPDSPRLAPGFNVQRQKDQPHLWPCHFLVADLKGDSPPSLKQNRGETRKMPQVRVPTTPTPKAAQNHHLVFNAQISPIRYKRSVTCRNKAGLSF